MGILIVRLKAIEYKEDFSRYLSFFQTSVFRQHAFQSYHSGRIPSGLSLQAAYLQDPQQTYLPKPQILDLFQQSKPPVCWVFCWLCARRLIWQYRSQLFSCYCIAATRAIGHQKAVFIASNKPYSYHLHDGSKGLRLCIKLLIWLGLICMMTKLLICNYKAIKGDLNPQRNQIKEDCFPTNGKMVEWR